MQQNETHPHAPQYCTQMTSSEYSKFLTMHSMSHDMNAPFSSSFPMFLILHPDREDIWSWFTLVSIVRLNVFSHIQWSLHSIPEYPYIRPLPTWEGPTHPQNVPIMYPDAHLIPHTRTSELVWKPSTPKWTWLVNSEIHPINWHETIPPMIPNKPILPEDLHTTINK